MDNKQIKIFFKIIGVFLALVIMLLIPLKIRDLYYRSETEKLFAGLREKGIPTNAKELSTWNVPPTNGYEEFKVAIELIKKLQEDYSACHKEEDSFLSDPADSLNDNKEYDKYKSDYEKRVMYYRNNPAFYKEWYVDKPKPIFAALDKALEKEYLLPDYNYENFGDQKHDLMEWRNIALLIGISNRTDLLISKNPDAALKRIEKQLQLSSALRCTRTCIDYLVVDSMFMLAVRSMQDVVFVDGVSPDLLRRLALSFEHCNIGIDSHLRSAFFSEMIIYENTAESIFDLPFISRPFDFKNNAVRESIVFIYKTFFKEYDHYLCIKSTIELAELSDKSWRYFQKYQDGLRDNEFTDNEVLVGFINCTTPMYGFFSEPLQSIITKKFEVTDRLRIAAIACQLLADKLEGKAYPDDLGGYPKNVFDGKDYKIVKERDWVYIISDFKPENGDFRLYNSPVTDAYFDGKLFFALPANPK